MPKPEVERQKSILNVLQGMQGIEPLKKLFWTELNYDRTNSPLPRKGWGELASTALAEDPVLFATGGNDFHVIHARLNSDKLLMSMERPVVSRLLQNHPYALFVFSNAKQDRWHFVNVKYDDDVQRRRLLRRITVGPEDRPYLRTASERLDKINLADARDHAPITIQKLHDDAFDVEPVTKEFFHEYGRIFEEVENSIRGLRDEERKHLFTQRLFNRIMFIAFIQKKGWLKLDGNTDYLSALWRAHERDNTIEDKNFYRDRLKPLFFFGLNSWNEVNQIGINRGGFLKILIGEVPYLNGGLFEEDEDDRDSKIVVPDKALDAVLNDLFARFNFTVTESTPLDMEVAVDPEMLGKVFEELVTGRHETGSYYTPKPIVSFMSREALKSYLVAQLPGEDKQAIDEFVEAHAPANLRNAEAVLETLRRIKVCDPACGSGAYLVGMLHELLDLRACLFVTTKLDAKSVYDRKLEIIQNSLYGVDIDPFAVNIARLRLWLSLAVDFDGANPPPLPNLDYKVETGDSICSANPTGDLELGFRKALVDKYLGAKSDYMMAHHGHKVELREQIQKLREDIRTWAHRSHSSGFDWPIEFAEVFLNGGFDIVVANPPYVSAMEFARVYPPEYREELNRLFRSARGAYDLYIPFFERGLSLLNRNGILAYISPNKYLAARYAVALRTLILETAALRKVVDLSAVKVFTDVSVYPVLTFITAGVVEHEYHASSLIPRNRETADADLTAYESATFPSTMLRLLPECIWGFLLSPDAPLMVKVIAGARPLSEFGEVNATSTAGESDDFTTLLSESCDGECVKIVNTGTIDQFKSLWGVVKMTHSGRKLLKPYLKLNPKVVNERRRKLYHSPKVLFAKMARECEAFLDWRGEYASMNTNCFHDPRSAVDLEYVAAFCNSKLFMFIYRQFFGALRMSGGYYQFQAPQLRVIPLRDASDQQKQRLKAMVDRVTRNARCAESTLKQTLDEINHEFYAMYALSAAEIATVEKDS